MLPERERELKFSSIKPRQEEERKDINVFFFWLPTWPGLAGWFGWMGGWKVGRERERETSNECSVLRKHIPSCSQKSGQIFMRTSYERGDIL